MRLGPSQETCLAQLKDVVRQDTSTRYGAVVVVGPRGTGKTTVLNEVAVQAKVPVISGLEVLKAAKPALSTPIDFSGAHFARILIAHVRRTTGDQSGAVVVDTLPILALMEGAWSHAAGSPRETMDEFLRSLATAYTYNKPILVELSAGDAITDDSLAGFAKSNRLIHLDFTDGDSRQAYWTYRLNGRGVGASEFRSYYHVRAAVREQEELA